MNPSCCSANSSKGANPILTVGARNGGHVCGLQLNRRCWMPGGHVPRWNSRLPAGKGGIGPLFNMSPKIQVPDLEAPTLSPETSPSSPKKSPQPPIRPPESNMSLKVVWKKVLKELSSLPRAIAVLAIIAGLSALGTIIEQGRPVEFYIENYPDGAEKILGFLTYKWIFFLQLDHIYSSSYFLAFNALLAAQLVACTTTTQLPMFKVARRWQFQRDPARILKLDNSEVLPDARVKDLGRLLNDKGYQVFLKDGSMYAFDGLSGRLAPIFVHFSMLLTMAGVVYGVLGGYKGSVMVPEGSEFQLERAMVPNSFVSSLPSSAKDTLRVNSFDVQYRSDGSISQFFSDLSVVNDVGDELARKTISVNDPLRYEGITLYQSEWSMAALVVKAKGSPIEDPSGRPVKLPLASLEGRKGFKGKVWATFIPVGEQVEGQKPRGISVLARDFQSVVVYGSDGQFAGVRRPGSGTPLTVDDIELTIEDIIGSTGMEIKRDPGVPIVYAGFGGLMLTTALSYLSHSQIWALQQGTNLLVAGKTNRAKVQFKQDLSTILDSVPEVPPEAPSLT